MTGKDLIIYILKNDLEDKPVYANGKLLGFMNVHEAAAKMNVGVATIFTWLGMGKLSAIAIGSEIFIPMDAESPMKEKPYEVIDGVEYYACK